jgi:hypothetical protein
MFFPILALVSDPSLIWKEWQFFLEFIALPCGAGVALLFFAREKASKS